VLGICLCIKKLYIFGVFCFWKQHFHKDWSIRSYLTLCLLQLFVVFFQPSNTFNVELSFVTTTVSKLKFFFLLISLVLVGCLLSGWLKIRLNWNGTSQIVVSMSSRLMLCTWGKGQFKEVVPRHHLHKFMVDTLVLHRFAHSYRMLSGNILFIIQRNVLICKQSSSNSWHDSLLTYITAIGHCFQLLMWTLNAFVHC